MLRLFLAVMLWVARPSWAWSPSPMFQSPSDLGKLMVSRSQTSQLDTAPKRLPSLLPPTSEWDQEKVIQRTLNGIFLMACFGGALYTILNIDHGMTRGWTQSEIAMRIPFDTWSSYESALSSKPIMTKTIINVVVYLLGDWLSQTIFQKKNILDFDVQRTLKNGFIGLCFGPLVHEYYEWSDTILPVDGGVYTRLEKIFMDQTTYLPIKCSIYVSAVGLLAGEDWEAVKNNVKERIGPICFAAWKFWPLVHCLTYSIIPARHRILWVNSVDLVWNAILSSKARTDEPEISPQTETPAVEDSSDVPPRAATVDFAVDEDSLAASQIQGESYEGVVKVLDETSCRDNSTAPVLTKARL